MAFMQPARIYTCSNCGWKKIIPAHPDAMLPQDMPPKKCDDCESTEIKGYRYETLGSKLKKWLFGMR
jgi:hypothetical protein